MKTYDTDRIRRWARMPGITGLLMLAILWASECRMWAGGGGPPTQLDPMPLRLEPGFGRVEVPFEDLFDGYALEELERPVLGPVRPSGAVEVKLGRESVRIREDDDSADSVQFAVSVRHKPSGGTLQRLVNLSLRRGSVTPDRQRPLLVVLIHGFSRPDSDITEWLDLAAKGFAASARRLGVAPIQPNLVPVPLETIEAVRPGDRDQLLSRWRGSRDLLAVDWRLASNDGVSFLDGDIKAGEHHAAVDRAAAAHARLIHAWLEERRAAGHRECDLLILAHSFGAAVGREVVTRLANGGQAGAINALKCCWLDPVTVKADASSAPGQVDKRWWGRPEYQGLVTSVSAYIQTDWPIVGSLGISFAQERDLEFGTPLDGEWGGRPAGFFENTVRVFQPLPDGFVERGRYRHLNGQEKVARGRLTDLTYVPGRSAWASGDSRGHVRVVAENGLGLLHSFEAGGPVQSLAALGEVLAVASRSPGRLSLRRLPSGNPTVLGVEGIRNVVAVPGLGFAYGTANGQVGLVDLHGRSLWVTNVDTGSIGALAVSGNRLVAGTLRGSVRAVDIGAGGVRPVWNLQVPLGQTARIRDLTILPDGRTLVATGVQLWCITPATVGAHGLRLVMRDIQSVVPVGPGVAVAGRDGSIRLLRGTDLAEVTRLNRRGNALLPVRQLCVSANGDLALIPEETGGGPVSDHEANSIVRKVTGFWERQTIGGGHRAVPKAYIECILGKDREPFLWNRQVADLARPARLNLAYTGGGPATGMPVPKTNITDLVLWEGESRTLELSDLIDLGGAADVEIQVSAPGIVNAVLSSTTPPRLTLHAVRAPSLRFLKIRIHAENDLGWGSKEVGIAVIGDAFRDITPAAESARLIATAVASGQRSAQLAGTAINEGNMRLAQLRSLRSRIDTNAVGQGVRHLAALTNELTSAMSARNRAVTAAQAAAASLGRSESEFRSANDRLAAATTVRQAAQAEVEQARQRLARARPSERAAAQRALNAAEAARDNAVRNQTAVRNEVSRAENALDVARSANRRAQNELTSASQTVADVERRLRLAVEQFAARRADVASAISQWSAIGGNMESGQAALLATRNQLASAHRAHSALTTAMTAPQPSLGREWSRIDGEIRRLKREAIEPLGADEKRHTGGLNSLRQEHGRLEPWIRTLQALLR